MLQRGAAWRLAAARLPKRRRKPGAPSPPSAQRPGLARTPARKPVYVADDDRAPVPPVSRRERSLELFAALRRQTMGVDTVMDATHSRATAAAKTDPTGPDPQLRLLPDDFISRLIRFPASAGDRAKAAPAACLSAKRKATLDSAPKPLALPDGAAIPRLRVSGPAISRRQRASGKARDAPAQARVNARILRVDRRAIEHISTRVLSDAPAVPANVPVGNPAFDAIFGPRPVLRPPKERGAVPDRTESSPRPLATPTPLRDGVRTVAKSLLADPVQPRRRPLPEAAAAWWARVDRGRHRTDTAETIGLLGYSAAIERLAAGAVHDEQTNGRAQYSEDVAAPPRDALEEWLDREKQAAKAHQAANNTTGSAAAELADACHIGAGPITEDELVEAMAGPQAAEWREWCATEHDELDDSLPSSAAGESLLEIGPAWNASAPAHEASGGVEAERRSAIGAALLETAAFEVVMANLSAELKSLHACLAENDFFASAEAVPPAWFDDLSPSRTRKRGSNKRAAATTTTDEVLAAFEKFAESEEPMLEALTEARRPVVLWNAWRLHRLRATIMAFAQHVVHEGSRGAANDAQRVLTALSLHTTDVASPSSVDEDFTRTARFDFRAAYVHGVVRDAVREQLQLARL